MPLGVALGCCGFEVSLLGLARTNVVYHQGIEPVISGEQGTVVRDFDVPHFVLYVSGVGDGHPENDICPGVHGTQWVCDVNAQVMYRGDNEVAFLALLGIERVRDALSCYDRRCYGERVLLSRFEVEHVDADDFQVKRLVRPCSDGRAIGRIVLAAKWDIVTKFQFYFHESGVLYEELYPNSTIPGNFERRFRIVPWVHYPEIPGVEILRN